jgi:hypothetical protein
VSPDVYSKAAQGLMRWSPLCDFARHLTRTELQGACERGLQRVAVAGIPFLEQIDIDHTGVSVSSREQPPHVVTCAARHWQQTEAANGAPVECESRLAALHKEEGEGGVFGRLHCTGLAGGAYLRITVPKMQPNTQ